MLEELAQFISRMPRSYSLAMPRLNLYLSQLLRGTNKLVWRTGTFTSTPNSSTGIDFLNSLITRADIEYLIKFENDFSRFIRVNHEYRSPNYGDFIRQYPIKDNAFIYSKRGSTTEYCLITDDFDIVQNLPLGEDDFKLWAKVAPIRMLSNDSPELLLDMVTSKLRYRKKPPKEVVFSINIMKLLMVYTKYRLIFPEIDFNNLDGNYHFIYKFCLLPLIYDNVKCWMMKIIHDIIMLKKEDSKALYDTSNLIIGEKSTFVLGGRHSAILELENIITKCAEGKVRPDEVLNSVCIAVGINLSDEINWIMDSNYIGNRGIQFRWAAFEREYFILSTMVALYSLQPDSNRYGELKTLFEIMAGRMNNARFWAGSGNPMVSSAIHAKFTELCTMMDVSFE